MSQIESLKSQVQIRDATEADVPFIFNSWLKSFQSSARSISAPIYFEFQHKVIEQILKRSQVSVLCSASDPNELYGYLVHEMVQSVPVLHYAYIKHSFRRMGLLNILLAKALNSKSAFYTHETLIGRKIATNKQLIYNPYLTQGGL